MHPFCYRVFCNERKAVIYRRPLQCSVVHISSQFSPLTVCFVAIERKKTNSFMILYSENKSIGSITWHSVYYIPYVSIMLHSLVDEVCLFVGVFTYLQNCSLIWRRGGWRALYLKFITVCLMDINTKVPSFKSKRFHLIIGLLSSLSVIWVKKFKIVEIKKWESFFFIDFVVRW